MQPIVIAVLAILSAYLLTKLILQKREIRNLSGQMDTICSDSSHKKLDLLLIDQDLNDLAAKLNRYMEYCEVVQIDRRKEERKLKEAVSNISHDLRTPLTSIIGYLQLIDRVTLSPDQTRHIAIIESKSNQMKELVEAFFQLSLLESGESKPNLERINLTNLLSDLMVEHVPKMEDTQFIPSINLPEYPIYIIADRNMLIRAVSNLLDNALRYGERSLAVSLHAEELACHIAVSNGISTPLDIDASRLFDRFYTMSPQRGNGTGLGLPIVKLLMEGMGGSVEAVATQTELRIACIIPIAGAS